MLDLSRLLQCADQLFTGVDHGPIVALSWERVQVTHRRIWCLTGAVAGFVLVTFAVLAPLLPESWGDVRSWDDAPRMVVGVTGAALLATDVVLPVPSSLVMVGLGATLGFASGLLAGTAGLTCSAAIGYGVGRLGRSRARAWLGAEHATLGRAMDRHGLALVVASRPVPVLAETVAVLAGCAGMSAGRVVLASAVGSLATAGVYAAVGAGLLARGSLGWWALVGALVLAVDAWLLGHRWSGRPAQPETEAGPPQATG